MITKNNLPPFIELTHILPDVAKLIESYNSISHRTNDEQFYQYADIKPYTASAFPIKENGYTYTSVTDISTELKNQWKSASPMQMYKWAARGLAPALDDRNFTEIIPDIPEYVCNFLGTFKGVVSRTRYAVLRKGHTIKEHIDNDIHHTIRIHIPLITDQYCIFGVRPKSGTFQYVHMEVGKVYFLNAALPHLAINAGQQDRLHFIVNLNTHEDILPYINE